MNINSNIDMLCLSFLPLALLSGGGGLEDQPPPVGVANPKSKNNYASVDCGAKVIRHNPEAKVQYQDKFLKMYFYDNFECMKNMHK